MTTKTTTKDHDEDHHDGGTTTTKTGSGTTTGSGGTNPALAAPSRDPAARLVPVLVLVPVLARAPARGAQAATVAPPSPPIVLSGDQPGPSNTGVPAGTALTVMNGDLTITTAGATYSNLDIHGYVVIKAPNVTVKNSIIRGGTGTVGRHRL